MNSPESTARPNPLRLALRGLAAAGLVAGLTLIVDAVLLSWLPLPSMRKDLFDYLDWISFAQRWELFRAVCLVVVGVPALVFVVRRAATRSLRGWVIFGLLAGCTTVAALVLAAAYAQVLDGFEQLFAGFKVGEEWWQPGVVPLFALLVVVPVAVAGLIWWRRWHSWRWIGGGYAVLLPVFAYLAHDDAKILRPLTPDEIAPSFAGADRSYAVLMRYARWHPSDEAKAFETWEPKYRPLPGGPDQPAEWTAYLQAHRAEIEADWVELAPQRRWLDELNSFDRIGDLFEDKPGADYIAFKVWRQLSMHASALAGLQALDGRGDEAFATLLPILQVSRKLEPFSRYVVRYSIARSIQREPMAVLGFVLDHTSVSRVARENLVAAIGDGDSAGGSGRFFALQYAHWVGYPISLRYTDVFLDVSGDHGSPVWAALNLVSLVFYNPRRTANELGALTAEMTELAAHREIEKMALRLQEFDVLKHLPLKNPLGALLVGQRWDLDKIAASYWKLEDQRTAIHDRLVAGGPR